MRTKDTYDGALPSGNSIAAEVFYSMALITGEKQYAQAFEKILTAMGPAAKLHPMSYTALLSAALLRDKGLRVEIAPALFEELRGYTRWRSLPGRKRRLRISKRPLPAGRGSRRLRLICLRTHRRPKSVPPTAVRRPFLTRPSCSRG